MRVSSLLVDTPAYASAIMQRIPDVSIAPQQLRDGRPVRPCNVAGRWTVTGLTTDIDLRPYRFELIGRWIVALS